MTYSHIQTKLVPPGSRVSLLPRPHLLERIRTEGAGCHATLICAGAGYGKSELAAALHRGLEAGGLDDGVAPCWYTLDHSDRDPAVFLVHLAASLDGPCPGVLDTTREILAGEGADAGLRSGLGELINRVYEHRPRQILLVLDDFHEVDGSAIVRHSVEQLLRHTPSNLHLVICTRRQPELELLSRGRVAGNVLELDERDLRLTPEETARLFRDVYGLHLDDEVVDIVHARTDGWLAGAQLFQQYLRGLDGGASAATMDNLGGGPSELFDYLGREVLAGERPEMHDLFLRSSVLERLSGPLCDAVTGRTGSGALLEEAHHRRLFLHPLDEFGDWYRFHPMFREFLHRRLDATEGDAGRRDAHLRAAQHFLERNQTEDAVRHFLAAGESKLAARLLVDLGHELVRAGRFEHLEGWLEQIDDDLKDEHPWLWLHLGHMAYLRAEGSHAAVDRALQRFQSLGDELGVVAANREKARALFRLGRYAEAAELGRTVLEGLRDDQRAERGEVLRLLGLCAAESTDLDEAERYLDRALVLYREAGDREEQARCLDCLAKIYFPQGQFRRAVTAGRQALEWASDHQLSFIYLKLGQAHRLLGEHEEAREALDALNEICQQRDLPVHACFALCLEGDILFDNGEHEAAGRLYAQAQGLGQLLGEPHMRIAPWMELGRVHRSQGRFGQAREAEERALETAQELGYAWFVGVALNELGGTHLAAGDVSTAADLLEQAATRLEAMGARYELAVCRLRQAWIGRQQGERGFAVPLEACLLLSQAEGYDYLLLQREAEIGLPLLVDALAANLQPDVVTDLLARSGRVELIRPLLERDSRAVRYRAVEVLRRMGGQQALRLLSSARGDASPDVAEAAREALEHLADAGPPPLRIMTLGTFEVWRGDERIEPREWGGRRVKDLFKLLLVRRGAPIVRDVLLDALWPDLAPDAALNNLNVTFSALRRVLEPWLKPREPSSYIVSLNSTYRFDVRIPIDLDADRFMDLARHARELGEACRWPETVEVCEAAVAIHRGEFLPENRYDDWAALERERLSNTKAEVLFLSARALAAMDRIEDACRACREVLQLQPFSEHAHRELMRYLAQMGKRMEALDHYEECRRVFETELGVVVSRETQELHRRIEDGERV